ncbi:Zn(2)-C6 fungal-type domain-containing protein [Mycena venus]|uniref:Zn(2)-C6 fungal-type domain-containing protein n=1 Tax=Mycena venus TaxID=2733690 RepID=A0A8H6Z3D0_9AGAR|nr:Zn(2)-C6 fungal-type domain-containing protein [Mycena venus]
MSPEVVDQQAPRRRRQRACDMCRRKKRRCDGGDICAHCKKFNFTCTYMEPAAIRNVANIHDGDSDFPDTHRNEYAQALSRRLEIAETSLQHLKHHPSVQPPLFIRAIRAIAEPFSPPHPEDSDFADIVDSFKTLSLDSEAPGPGFQGQSSAAVLVKAVVEVKTGGEHVESRIAQRNRPPPRNCGLKPWETQPAVSHDLSFPEDQLMSSLVSLYFSNINVFLPLLHRPTFEASLNQQLHLHDRAFGTTLLLVCALGSLCLDGESAATNHDRENLAWRWYNQVELCGHSLRQIPSLYDIQAYCLAVQFLHTASNPRFAWMIAGFGLRLAQDLGFHRTKLSGSSIATTEELEKRAFWILVFLDTLLSGALGRSAVHDPVELDLTMPCECDDEYWFQDHLSGLGSGRGVGVQPANKPSKMAFFNCLINLYRILHFSLRTFYTTHANHMRMARTTALQDYAAELNLTLDKWFSCIPPHLIWNPTNPNALFFDQSAALYCLYYYTRIIIHRPSVPGLSSTSPPDPLALRLCTEAAQACICVADVHQQRRGPGNPLLFSQSPIFTSALMLILNINKSSAPGNLTDRALVSTSIRIFKSQREWWSSSEFFITVLERLVSMDDEEFSSERLEDVYIADSYPDSGAHALSEVVLPTHTWANANPSRMNTKISQTPQLPREPQSPVVPILPTFVGDEEIVPRRGFRPAVILAPL